MIGVEIKNINYAFANGIVFVLEKRLIRKQEFAAIARESFDKCVGFIENKNKIYAGEFKSKNAWEIGYALKRVARKFYAELEFFYPDYIIKPFSIKHELYDRSLLKSARKEMLESIVARFDSEIFAAKRKLAERTRSEGVKEIIKAEIDLNNLKALLRADKQKRSDAFLEKVIIEGGKMNKKEILENYRKNKDSAYNLFISAYGEKAKKLIELFNSSPQDFDKEVDNILISIARELSKKTLGEEQLVAYIYAFENEIKNIGILLKGKAYNLEEKEIISLLRDAYAQ